MTEPVSISAGGALVVTAGGITILGVATGLHPALLLAGAAGGWWALSYQSDVSAWGRVHRIIVSALVAAWGAPAIAFAGFLPASIPAEVVQFPLAVVLGLVTIDVLGRGLLGIAKRKLNGAAGGDK